MIFSVRQRMREIARESKSRGACERVRETRKGGREGGREEGREGGREGGRKGGREGGREGEAERETSLTYACPARRHPGQTRRDQTSTLFRSLLPRLCPPPGHLRTRRSLPELQRARARPPCLVSAGRRDHLCRASGAPPSRPAGVDVSTQHAQMNLRQDQGACWSWLAHPREDFAIL